jgi:YggT family protein
MGKLYIINFLNLLINAYMILIFIRVILSWVPSGLGSFRKVIFDLTEPVLGPARKIIPPLGGLDLSPIVVFIILQILQSYIVTL